MRAERHRRAGCRTQPGTVTMNMTTLFSQMFVLAILMGIGFLARRVQVMDAGFSRQLSGLLLHIAIPAMIIASVGKGDPFADISDMLYVLGICTLVNALMVPLAALCVRLLRIREDKATFRFMFALSNAGFMGLPVITSVFGARAGVYAALYLLPNNFLMFGYGARLFQHDEPFSWKRVCNAPVCATLIACLICLTQVALPAVIQECAELLGAMTTPSAMLIIGAALADTKLGALRKERVLIPFTLLRMCLIPLCCFALLRLFVHDETLIQVCVLMSAMPVATNAVIFASSCGRDTGLCSRAVFVTTLVSVISVPLLYALLFH